MADKVPALAGLALLLAGCSGDPGPEPVGDAIACALGGEVELADQCVAEMAREDGATILVVHHPDGGFRRFTVLPSGGLMAADGADRAEVAEGADALAVSINGDRYVVPNLLISSDAQ